MSDNVAIETSFENSRRIVRVEPIPNAINSTTDFIRSQTDLMRQLWFNPTLREHLIYGKIL